MPGSILLAAPTGAAFAAGLPSPWTHMTHTWTGWDGSEWELATRKSAVFLLAGVRGLTMKRPDRYTSESPSVAGSRWRGHRIPEREVFWPVKIWTDTGSQAWVEYDRAFWRTMHPDKTGVWTVTQPSGESRSLRLRFEDDGDPSFDTDPALRGWARYGITLVAEDPYWSGEPITQEWQATVTAADFFPGPPFEFASSHTIATAVLTNPGEIESWPVWTVKGPFTAAEVGVDGNVVEVPFSLLVDEYLTIDTDPRAQTAITDAGVDRTGDLGAVDFTPVPAGQFVPLDLSLTGTGSIAVSLQPKFYRAW